MQVTLYRCGLCNNHDFDRPFKVERHMDEQPSFILSVTKKGPCQGLSNLGFNPFV
jgi:hypothetical protein